MEPDSEDEVEISLDDLAYLRQVERRSYLMKRSRKNHRVWHKRYCVLSDKLWVINVHSQKPRASRIDLNEPGKVHVVDDILGRGSTSAKNSEERVYEFVLDNGQGGGAYHFRASSSKELSAWYDDLSYRTITSAEDSVIQMAELIMSEETRMRSERLKNSYMKALDSKTGNVVMDATQKNIHTKNLEVLKDRKTVKRQVSTHVDSQYRSSTSEKYAVYNGMALPIDVERLESLNNGEEAAQGSASRSVLGGMFRRRSGSNLTSERLFGSSSELTQSGNSVAVNGKYAFTGGSSSGSAGGSRKVRGLSREASSNSLKALEGVASEAAMAGSPSRRETEVEAGQQHDRRNVEFMCRYYQGAGAGDSDSSSSDDDTTDEEGDARGDEGGGGTVATSKLSAAQDSELTRRLSYFQVTDVDMFQHLSRFKRRQSAGAPHSAVGALINRNRHTWQQQQQEEGQGEHKTQAGSLQRPPPRAAAAAAAAALSQFHVSLALLHAVHNWKECRRKDAHMGAPSPEAVQRQWQSAAALFQEFLCPRLLVGDEAMEEADPRELVARLTPSPSCFGLSAVCISKVMEAVSGAVEWCTNDYSGSSDQDDDKGLSHRQEEEAEEESGEGGARQQPRSLSQSGQTASFWGAVFGSASPAVSSSSSSSSSGQQQERGAEGSDDGGSQGQRQHPKFFLPFPPGDVLALPGDTLAPTGARTETLWAYLCTRRGAEVYHRQRVVACRVRTGARAPAGDLFDSVVEDAEASLNAIELE